jgi:hypothetical protein
MVFWRSDEGMDTDILKQFDMTRDLLMNSIQTETETDAEYMPNGFNNTIKWHVGHILFAANRAFAVYQSASYLPEHYGCTSKRNNSRPRLERCLPIASTGSRRTRSELRFTVGTSSLP